MLVFHWSQLTPMHCLFFIVHGLHSRYHCLLFFGYGLHSRNASFSLAMVYTHAMFVFHWSQSTPTHCLLSGNYCVDFICGRMYLSVISTGFITGQRVIFHKVQNRTTALGPMNPYPFLFQATIN